MYKMFTLRIVKYSSDIFYHPVTDVKTDLESIL